MSNLLDDLARNLASPMPRRRAVRVLGGAIVAAVVPSFWTSSARAGSSGTCPPGGQQTCEQQFGKGISECCSRPIPGSGNYTCCAPGECFYSPTTNTCCPKDFQCGKGGCCSEGERCVNEKCVRCDSDKDCGTQCCAKGEVCANPGKSLCCKKDWGFCKVAGAAGPAGAVVKCCPPKHECCSNAKTGTVACCDSEHPCVDGRCRCKKGESRCGDSECCKKDTEVCSHGTCCPKGKVNCGDGRCCDPDKCCGKTCGCEKGEFCGSTIAYSIPKVCCPLNRTLAFSGKRVCCPKGTLANNTARVCCPGGDPTCCSDGDDELSCLGNAICVRGTCQRVS